MQARKRIFSTATAVGYLLTVTVSALFHSHNCCGRPASRPGVYASHCADEHDCSVCQFLAQKPAPTAEVSPVDVGSPVEEVVAAAPLGAVGDVFSAWHSRAPPSVA